MSDTKYYLAVDIGASSGRHILAHMEDGKIVLEEMHRFANGMDEVDGQKVWDVERLHHEILEGMKKCKAAGKVPVSMGIDTWAVDYALLDERDQLLGPVYAYRDARTTGLDEEVYKIIPEKELYEETGIQKAIFNSIYQLMATKKQHPEILKQAKTLLMVPDYLHFRLTGKKCQEYTNATTTQLVDAKTKEWKEDWIAALGFPREVFQEIQMPGTNIGNLTPEIQKEVGFDCDVILPATHDTGSAVMAVPSNQEDTLYISSGTWSLLGCELQEANCSKKAQEANFTNEGGYEYRYRFLKNIMGLWMIQSVRKEWIAEEMQKPNPVANPEKYYSFANLCAEAAGATIDSLVDANDGRFLAPKSMVKEIQAACVESGQKVPETPWEVARVIYRSLAVCYREAVKEVEAITGKKYQIIHVVGGGSNAAWLNELTAQETEKTVVAGPGEATAIGNIGAQLIADHVYADLNQFRKGVWKSFPMKVYNVLGEE